MSRAMAIEWWKVRRSRVTLTATGLLTVLLPLMGLAFFEVATAEAGSALGLKAQALLTGDGWAGYLGLVSQIAAVALFLGVGIVVAWMFGREYVEQTFAGLFARVVSRRAIASAKFIVLLCWIVVLDVVMCAIAALLGVVAGLGAWDRAASTTLIGLFVVGALSGLLGLTMGYVATVGRGYLAAIGALIVIIAAAQIAVLFGTGGWFPFAVPGLLAVAGSDLAPDISAMQMLLVPLLALITAWLTVRTWGRAEVV